MADYALALTEQELRRYRMMADAARDQEAGAWRSAGIVRGARVADIGCGPGAALLAMAETVGAEGTVTGVDADGGAVATAAELIEQSGQVNASVRVGQADATGLPPGSFDVAVMRHVLAHNGGRERAIVAHLASLVRPGGHVYLVDVDLTAGRFLGAEPEILELSQRYLDFHGVRGNDLQVGLRLGELLLGAGLEVVSHTGSYNILKAPAGMRPPAWAARDAMVAEGIATAEDIARWDAALARADAATQRPTIFMPVFSAIGRRGA